MINTLYLPELREALAEQNEAELREFCSALYPARTAEFMEGLTADEAWQVLRHAELQTRVEIFTFFDLERQVAILKTQNRDELADVVARLAADDRVDILGQLDEELLNDLLSRLPAAERRDIIRLSQYPEGTAGAVMTSEVAKVSESLTVREALEELGRQADRFETIYYVYIVDDADHLRGIVSARQLVSGLKRPNTPLTDLMEKDVVTCNAMDDQEEVANRVAKMDFLAIPVVDNEYRMLGIITHDDVIDVLREEATEDAHRIAGVEPLDQSYLKTGLLTISWKRGVWLGILFVCATFTVIALQQYKYRLDAIIWLAWFIPLVISSGGNSGSQSSALIIAALARGHLDVGDWWHVVLRELVVGLLLGTGLAVLGFLVSLVVHSNVGWRTFAVLPITLLLVVMAGTLTGCTLPLVFKRLGWDPALMSNPFVTVIIDILGIVIYMNVAFLILGIPERT